MNVLVGRTGPTRANLCGSGSASKFIPADAAALGIGMVHQNFMLVLTMTVAENIILGLTDRPLCPGR